MTHSFKLITPISPTVVSISLATCMYIFVCLSVCLSRWIKFEEDVEEGSGRWGRPHISALDFHSLADLRTGLESGEVSHDYHVMH